MLHQAASRPVDPASDEFMASTSGDAEFRSIDPAEPRRGRRVIGLVGSIVVGAALSAALAAFLVLAGMTPIRPTNDVVVWLLLLNFVLLLGLIGVVGAEVFSLWRARRAGAAGSRLHQRIVFWFGLIAGVPAILVAIVASVSLSRGLDDWLAPWVKAMLEQTVDVAASYQNAQCQSIGRESRLMAGDIDRAKVMWDANRDLFRDFFNGRATYMGFRVAAILNTDGSELFRVEPKPIEGLEQPTAQDVAAAKEGDGLCLLDARTSIARGLVPLGGYNGAVLFVARMVDPKALLFPQAAQQARESYERLERAKTIIIFAFAAMFGLVSLILLASAVWLGLSFANWLVVPVRRLIQATDQVALGNYYVQVPTKASEGDLAHLGTTFNKMTAELRAQHDRISVANDQIDRRRRFTEAVLSGVSAGVIGLDATGIVTVLNPSAERILGTAADAALGRRLAAIAPELEAVLREATDNPQRLVQREITLARARRERRIDVRVTGEQQARPADTKGFVVTLDDITDLVTAQRTSAWADVARRIAHEIKNPLTPIQLSAERIKRRYGKVITQDREVFDQCTDTIVRQVDDIRRMVDEFASFARMPKPVLERDDLVACVKQVTFLMRVGNPDIVIEDHFPEEAVLAKFDRRQLGQALTNLVKNATEGIAALPEEERGAPRIDVTVAVPPGGDAARIDIADSGKGFPTENRQRLLEPYMTTREGGTGLGLAIVGKILEDHGGSIELLDNPSGRGALVRLTVPLAGKPAGTEEAELKTKENAAWQPTS